MTEIISLNQLYDLFKYFADNHKQLRDFGYGGLDNTGTGREMKFPYLWITRETPSSVNYNKLNNTFVQVEALTFVIVDQHNIQENTNDDLSYSGLASDNGVEITSDMRQIGADLLTYIKDYMTKNGIDLIEQSVIFEEILHETTDDVSGWKINLEVELNYSNCTIPGVNTIPGISSCPAGRYQNSNNSFNLSIPSGSIVTSDDIEVTVNASTYSTTPSNLDVNVVVKDTDGNETGSLIGGEWIVGVPASTDTIYLRPEPTGQTISYYFNDDGYRIINHTDPSTLPSSGIPAWVQRDKKWLLVNDNTFGHKFVLTGISGGYWNPETAQYHDVTGAVTTRALAFPDLYAIDHNTGLGWKIEDNKANVNWETAMNEIDALTVAGFTDWFMPNVNELNSILNLGYIYSLGQSSFPTANAPFNQTSNGTKWSSTTSKLITSRAYYALNVGTINYITKTNNMRYMPCRYHYSNT